MTTTDKAKPTSKARKATTAKPAPAKKAAAPHNAVEAAAPAPHSPNIPGTVQYTDASGDTHVAYVNRRGRDDVFDLSYHVGAVKCLVAGVPRGTSRGTWQLLPEPAGE